jgi:hypothetical protein
MVICDLENMSKAYGRMREGAVHAGKDSVSFNGFPLLPGSPRHIEIPWTGKGTPDSISLHFDHFDFKVPLQEETSTVVASR